MVFSRRMALSRTTAKKKAVQDGIEGVQVAIEAMQDWSALMQDAFVSLQDSIVLMQAASVSVQDGVVLLQAMIVPMQDGIVLVQVAIVPLQDVIVTKFPEFVNDLLNWVKELERGKLGGAAAHKASTVSHGGGAVAH